MYIIRKEAYENGSRPALQTWAERTPPEGYAICPEEFIDIFYSTEPAGFVTLEIINNVVISMDVNKEAYEAYAALLVEPEPEPEPVVEPDMYDEFAAAIREGVNEI